MVSLQRRGEEDWKKRAPKHNLDLDINTATVDTDGSTNLCSPQDGTMKDETAEQQKKPQHLRKGSIVDRVSRLQSAQVGWQERVAEKDSAQFTVAGKMMLTRSPMLESRRQFLSAEREDAAANERRAHSQDRKEAVVRRRPQKRVVTGRLHEHSPAPIPAPRRPLSTPVLPAHAGRRDPSAEKEDGPVFESFFSSSKTSKKTLSEVHEDLDLDAVEGASLLSVPRRAPKSVRSKRRSRNPLRQMAAATTIEVQHQQLSATRSTPSKPSNKHAHLALEALAGLASKEDFSSVQLRSGETSAAGRDLELAPYKADLMLLQVKGRRVCQVRLAAPEARSVNSGDAFVLVTPEEVFLWQGRFSNVIERSRSAELAQIVYQKRDLTAKRAKKLHHIEEEKSGGSSKAEKDFWRLLGSSDAVRQVTPAGPAEEDEEFESSINELNMVWEVGLDGQGKETLLPLEEAWGHPLRHQILDPSKVLVIDFGAEAYVWSGKGAPLDLRQAGANLLKQVWGGGFDFTGAGGRTNPMLSSGAVSGPRPTWGVHGRVTQNMETTLFKGKFVDWPESSSAKKPRMRKDEERVMRAVEGMSGEIEVEPFDAEEMASWRVSDPNLKLEGSCLGRGDGFYDEEERRQYQVETVSLRSWHVSEDRGNTELSEDWAAQFHEGDVYVFRWRYKVSLTGRDLKGKPSRHGAVGRERGAYFFWQGARAGATEKGLSALAVVSLDEDSCPQIRVDQGREEAAFLKMWGGRMTVHRGHRSSPDPSSPKGWRLFVIRGEVEDEAMALEVDCSAGSLRSAGSFTATDGGQELVVWHGSSSPSHKREMAKRWADWVAKDCPPEMRLAGSTPLNVSEEFEGCESKKFSRALGLQQKQSDKICYAASLAPPTKSPRLFNMSSVSGRFLVSEVLCPSRRSGVLNAMPFGQGDLYLAEQPGSQTRQKTI